MTSAKESPMTSGRPTPEELDQSRRGWYLALAQPSMKPHPFSWLYPPSLYTHPKALRACVEDLAAQIDAHDLDYVAGIDSVGYVIGTALAYHLGKGFLCVTKAGKMCVNGDELRYSDYQKTEKGLEIAKQLAPRGSRVFVYDQWVETGGTMCCAITLLEGQGMEIAGIGAIVIEENDVTRDLGSRYRCVECCPSQLKVVAHGESSSQFFKACYEMYRKK